MILQFGAGNFLRAFVDLFVSESEVAPGAIVVVQSTGKERAEALNASQGRYQVAIQGFQDGRVIDEVCSVDSISRALHAGTEWPEVIATACSPELKAIVSNTTEAGLALDPDDTTRQSDNEVPPRSFPAKVLSVLLARFERGLPGVDLLPCELVEGNGEFLKQLVLKQAGSWGLDDDAKAWLSGECRWISSLVDRIVPGTPASHPQLADDPLLISAEPYAFWGVELDGSSSFPISHPAITRTEDLRPFTLRKVRILNGAHSALVSKGAEFGIGTVRECVEHPEVGPWLERLLFKEIVPTLEGRCEDPEGFALETLNRFRNPFLEHQLSAIALNHDAKVEVRLRPTAEEFQARFGRAPVLLNSVTGEASA